MPRATAKVNGKTIAETDEYEVVEGNIYFPPLAIDRSFFVESALTTICPWKGTASYYSINVDGTELENAAWYYPEPKDKAGHIKGYVAFCMTTPEVLFAWTDEYADKSKVDIQSE